MVTPVLTGGFNPCDPNPCGAATCSVEDNIALCHGKFQNCASDVPDIFLNSQYGDDICCACLSSTVFKLFICTLIPIYTFSQYIYTFYC